MCLQSLSFVVCVSMLLSDVLELCAMFEFVGSAYKFEHVEASEHVEHVERFDSVATVCSILHASHIA